MNMWRNPPPVVILSGGDEALRIRELRKAVQTADQTDREVQYVKGEEHEEIESFLSTTGILFEEKLLVVVNDPAKAPVEPIVKHHHRGDNMMVFVLHEEGDIKKKSNLGKIVEKLPERFVARFELPKPWEAHDRAVSFCVKEAKSHGIQLAENWAGAMVRNIGTNSGVLAFEVEKLAIYLGALGTTKVQSEHLSATLAAFTELGPKPIVDALERRDLAAAARALTNMRRTHAGQLAGAAAQACGFLGHNVRLWLHVAALVGEGLGLDEISEQTGLKSFRLRKNLLPVARRWGEGRLTSLLKSLATVERSVRSGHVNPWVEFECAIFRALEVDSAAVA